jgi:hypothetical protein
MQTTNRYYITRADDQPVVRTIPVALREEETHEATASVVEQPTVNEPRRSRRMPKIVRPALRKAARVSSDKL